MRRIEAKLPKSRERKMVVRSSVGRVFRRPREDGRDPRALRVTGSEEGK